jgi:hypothetical protein
MVVASGLSPMKLIVETERGLFIRVIESASPLAGGSLQGRSAEDAAHSAAAKWASQISCSTRDWTKRGRATAKEVLKAVYQYSALKDRMAALKKVKIP